MATPRSWSAALRQAEHTRYANIDVISGIVPGWGDSYEYFDNGVYDPDTKTITYDIGYYVYDFHIILKYNKPLE